MYKSYNQAVSYLNNVKDVWELKSKVSLFLLKNKYNDIEDGLTYFEKFNRLQNENNYVYNDTYEHFCGNIVTKEAFADNSLSYIEMHAISKVDESEGEKKRLLEQTRLQPNKSEIFTCIGELTENTDDYYVLTTFIDDRTSAEKFLNEYCSTNPFVKTKLIVSDLNEDVPCYVLSKNLTSDLIRPTPVSLRSVLRNKFEKTDEQIEFFLKRFPKELKRFIKWKKRGMKELTGLIWDILEYATPYFAGKEEEEILDCFLKNISSSENLGKSKKNTERGEVGERGERGEVVNKIITISDTSSSSSTSSSSPVSDMERCNKRRRLSVDRFTFSDNSDRIDESELSDIDYNNEKISDTDENYDSCNDSDDDIDKDAKFEYENDD